MEKSNIELSNDEVFILFTSLLFDGLRPHSGENKQRYTLLRKLWKISPDDRKKNSLLSKGFRKQMTKMDISYEEDVNRLELPKDVGENDDDSFEL